MDHLDVVTASQNPDIDDDDINMTLPDGWPVGLNTPKIVVRLRTADYGRNHDPRLRHQDINSIALSCRFTQSLADPNFYLRMDDLAVDLCFDEQWMLYPEAASKAVIEVTAKLSEKY